MQKFRFSSVMVTAISLALFMAGAISGCAQGKSVGQEPGFVLSACDSVENWGYLPGDPAVLSQCTRIGTDAGCIKVDFTKDEKGKRTLEQYNMNLGYCLFCGLCVKACPKDAINFKKDFDMVCYQKADTTYRWKKSKEEIDIPEVAVTSSEQPEGEQKGQVV
jgi:ferredoxin